jgi:hypothetical protein
VPALLAVHAALAIWGAARSSVTFDENFHLPAGVEMVVRGDPTSSIAQPPLAKSLAALPALLAGARPPAESSLGFGAEVQVGESFMRENADRYRRVFFAARLATVAMSVAVGWLVARFAGALYGPAAGVVAVAVWALFPDAIAHAGVVGVDVPTSLGLLASVWVFWRFCRNGRWRWWAATALAVGLTFLTRFSAVQLGPILLALAGLGAATGRLRRPRRVWIGLLLLVPTTLLALHAGYLGKTTLAPMAKWPAQSTQLQTLAREHPGWRVPLPDAYVAGLDYLAYLGGSGKPSYLLGSPRPAGDWRYFPIAMGVKWPLAFLALLLLRAAWAFRAGAPRGRWHEAVVLVPPLVVLASAMASHLDYGVRYLLPMVPFLCVWIGGLAAAPARLPAGARRGAPRLALGAAALLGVLSLETATAMPYPLSFFNLAAGGPGRGDRIVNDSNVDWGQGLVALKDALDARGITRVHLAYHGTADPALYGIASVPYRGGAPGPESDWLAVSSYYLVGLPSRMMLPTGPTEEFLRLDFSSLEGRTPEARPAGCMYLFKFR